MRKPTAKSVEEVNIYLEGLSLRIPDTSTDNAVARFDGTTGALQDSSVTVSDTGKVTLGDAGSTAGLEFGASGPRMMVGTGGPSGIAAPVGSTWRQTDANASHGSLKGLLWTRVTDPGTNSEGTDWLVDYEGRWIASATPTWTNVSMSSTTARHTRRGKHCEFTIAGTLSAAPTGAVNVTVPLFMASTAAMGSAQLQPNWAWPGVWKYSTSTSLDIYYIDGSSHYMDLGASAPEAWTSGDFIGLHGTYEIA